MTASPHERECSECILPAICLNQGRCLLLEEDIEAVEDRKAMTPKQYADAIDRLGLSQTTAGTFLGVDPRQSRRWIAGDSAIPESVAKLLRLMIRLKLTPEDV